MKKKAGLMMLVAVVLGITMVGATLAAVRANTSVKQKITTGKVGIALYQESKEGVPQKVKEQGIAYRGMPGDTIQEEVYVKNIEKKPIYVRVTLTKYWEKDGKKDVTADPKEIKIVTKHPENWLIDDSDVNGETFYFYYKKALDPAEGIVQTDPIMDEFKLLEGSPNNQNKYADLSAKVLFEADAVQKTAGEAAILAEWGMDVKLDDTGMMSAESKKKNDTASIVFSGETGKFGELKGGLSSFENMEPGESRTQEIVLKNEGSQQTKFYLSAEILENIAEAGVDGWGVYTIDLKKEGKIFCSGIIGSKESIGKEELSKNYFLAALEKGESVSVEMTIALDGDSTRNDYQNKKGEIQLNLSAEYENPKNTTDTKVVTKTITPKTVNPRVKTGDELPVEGWLVMGAIALAGIILILTAKNKTKIKQFFLLFALMSITMSSITVYAAGNEGVRTYQITFRAGSHGTIDGKKSVDYQLPYGAPIPQEPILTVEPGYIADGGFENWEANQTVERKTIYVAKYRRAIKGILFPWFLETYLPKP